MKTKNGSSSGKLFGDAGSQASRAAFSWDSLDRERLCKIIGLVTSRGGAIRFGYSRDGFAGSVGVYYGSERNTLYLRSEGDIDEIIGLLERTFEALPYSGGKSPDAG